MPHPRADIVIIGAGSAGSILATRLSEDPDCSVLLLEAGPDYPEFEHLPEEIKFVRYAGGPEITHGIHNWQFIAKATDTAPPMPLPRGKITGGSSAINYAAFLRGVPEDYDGWASLGNHEWSFSNVLPYFRKVETDPDFHDDYHGTVGAINIDRANREHWQQAQVAFYNACRAAGYPDSPDQNHPESTGVGPSPSNLRNGVRDSTALGYLSQARHRLNLTIRPNCMVHRILFDGKRATGVVVESGGQMYTVDGDHIILCAGAVGSPQLLMLSGVGPADQLKSLGIPVVQELPGVGQHLTDHPRVMVTWRANENLKIDPSAPRGRLSLRTTAQGSDYRNDLWITASASPIEGAGRGEGSAPPLGIQMLAAMVFPMSTGELRLASTDPTVQPLMDYNFLAEPIDRQRVRAATHLCLQLAEHPDLREIIAERIKPTDDDLTSDDALDAWMLREVFHFSHISGTCKMGPASDPMAAVDQYGMVRGLEGLRVVDASIIPTLIRAHTNFTVMMMGELMADLIRQGK